MITYYPLDIRDSTISTGDNRKTGLTLAIVQVKSLAAIPATIATSTVTVVEIGLGQYEVGYDPAINGEAMIAIDAGAVLTNPNDRYRSVAATQDSSLIATDLNASVSSVLTQIALVLTQATAANTGVTAINTDMNRINRGTVVADAGNSTTAATLSGITTSPGNLTGMRILIVNTTNGIELGERLIDTASINGSNVKITWITPLDSVPAVGYTASFP